MDDIIPRSRPAPYAAKVSAVQPTVPEVSLYFDDNHPSFCDAELQTHNREGPVHGKEPKQGSHSKKSGKKSNRDHRDNVVEGGRRHASTGYDTTGGAGEPQYYVGNYQRYRVQPGPQAKQSPHPASSYQPQAYTTGAIPSQPAQRHIKPTGQLYPNSSEQVITVTSSGVKRPTAAVYRAPTQPDLPTKDRAMNGLAEAYQVRSHVPSTAHSGHTRIPRPQGHMMPTSGHTTSSQHPSSQPIKSASHHGAHTYHSASAIPPSQQAYYPIPSGSQSEPRSHSKSRSSKSDHNISREIRIHSTSGEPRLHNSVAGSNAPRLSHSNTHPGQQPRGPILVRSNPGYPSPHQQPGHHCIRAAVQGRASGGQNHYGYPEGSYPPLPPGNQQYNYPHPQQHYTPPNPQHHYTPPNPQQNIHHTGVPQGSPHPGIQQGYPHQGVPQGSYPHQGVPQGSPHPGFSQGPPNTRMMHSQGMAPPLQPMQAYPPASYSSPTMRLPGPQTSHTPANNAPNQQLPGPEAYPPNPAMYELIKKQDEELKLLKQKLDGILNSPQVKYGTTVNESPVSQGGNGSAHDASQQIDDSPSRQTCSVAVNTSLHWSKDLEEQRSPTQDAGVQISEAAYRDNNQENTVRSVGQQIGFHRSFSMNDAPQNSPQRENGMLSKSQETTPLTTSRKSAGNIQQTPVSSSGQNRKHNRSQSAKSSHTSPRFSLNKSVQGQGGSVSATTSPRAGDVASSIGSPRTATTGSEQSVSSLNNETLTLSECHLSHLANRTEDSMMSDLAVDMPEYAESPDKQDTTCSSEFDDSPGRSPRFGDGIRSPQFGESVSMYQDNSPQMVGVAGEGALDANESGDVQLLFDDQKQFYENLIGGVKNFLAKFSNNAGESQGTKEHQEQEQPRTSTKTQQQDTEAKEKQENVPKKLDEKISGQIEDPLTEIPDSGPTGLTLHLPADLGLSSRSNGTTAGILDQSHLSVDDLANTGSAGITCLLGEGLVPQIQYMSMFLDKNDSPDSSDFDHLAMKYLTDDQLAELAKVQGGTSPYKNNHEEILLSKKLQNLATANDNYKSLRSPMTDVSMATHQYLEKYGLKANAFENSVYVKSESNADTDGPPEDYAMKNAQTIIRFLQSQSDDAFDNTSITEHLSKETETNKGMKPEPDDAKQTNRISGQVGNINGRPKEMDYKMRQRKTRQVNDINHNTKSPHVEQNTSTNSRQSNSGQSGDSSLTNSPVPQILDIKRLKELPKLL